MDDKTALAIRDKRPLHRVIYFPRCAQSLEEQIHVASMSQPQDHVTAEVLDQLPLKGPKPRPERCHVEIQDTADGHRTPKHHQRLGGIALARWGEPCCVAAQIKIGPCA
jgi:hypothetical protein